MRSRGFTLIELVVVVGVSLAFTCVASIALQRAQAPSSTAAATLHTLIDATRTLAADNNGSGSGAVLVVTASGNGSRVSILANRPLAGYDPPVAAAHFFPVDLPVPVKVANGSGAGFSLAVAPDGAIDLLQSPLTAGAAPIGDAPGCGTSANGNTVMLRIGNPPETSVLSVNCSDGSVTAS